MVTNLTIGLNGNRGGLWSPPRLLLLLVLLAGCAPQPTPYELALNEYRFQKDVSLANPETTILEPEVLAQFEGLHYYPVDSTYRFRVPLNPADSVRTILMAHRTPPPIPYRRLGTVEVTFPEGTEQLAVFQASGSAPGEIWLPFTDATSGTETYGGGRYLDGRLRDGWIELDFNRAYNPFCDYNEAYNCAIPPPENRLSVAVRAGEKASGLLKPTG